MGSSSFSMLLAFFSLFIAALVISSRATVAEASLEQSLRWVPTRHHCQGSSIAECMGAGDDEFEMDSEINRRILATTQYVSYGALQRNSVPCSLRGASYYNCKPGAQANPYARGCSAITRCRSN